MNSIRTILLGAIFTISAFCQGTTLAGCPVFPANNIWNTPIDTLPVSPNSANYVNNISSTSTLRYDIGIPINIVPGTTPLVPLSIASPTESDPGPYPIPANAQVEYSADMHVIVLDKDHCVLYETYNSVAQPDGSWSVDSAAKWSLLSNALRPLYWTSADAAGLPILPGVLRYDEVASGVVTHPIRFTAPTTQRAFVWPARHYASANTSAALPPMGQRFRLKAGFNISSFSPNVQTILTAMKKYGLILADNGLPWEMQFAIDPRWNTNDLDTLRTIAGSNFEAVDESGLTIDPNSGQAAPPGVPYVTVTPGTAMLGPSQAQQFSAKVNNSALGVVWSMSPQVGTLTAAGLYTPPAVVTTSQPVTITATLTGGAASGSATVTLLPAPPPAVASVALGTTSMAGGNTVNVTITLTTAAPPGGAAVLLTGSDPAFPSATVTVPAGLMTQTFTLPTVIVSAVTSVSVTGAYNGTSATSQVLTLTPPVTPAGRVVFIGADTTTSGSWKGIYGADGYNIAGDTVSYPAYATVTPTGITLNTWASSTTDTRALLRAASNAGRVAACWYDYMQFAYDVSFSDTNPHEVALYMLDWDNSLGGRSERIDVLDANGIMLDSRSISSFSGGLYLVWNVTGHVTLRIINTSPGNNAVVSGIFFGGNGTIPPSPPSGTVSFVKADTTTQGTWKGVYGVEGWNVIADAVSYPSYATVSAFGNSQYVWAASTADVRGLQKGSSTTGRVAACWYSSVEFTLDMRFNDTSTHQMALYLLDWDNSLGGRAERVDILDANNNNVLDSRSVSAFSTGQYLVWNLSGHVLVRITNTGSPSNNAVLSGIFFGGATATPSGTATYLKTDTTTEGTWKGVYGVDGSNVINDVTSYPSYVAVNPSGNSSYTWASSTTDVRALQRLSSSTGRIAACWYAASFRVDLRFNDTNPHQVAVYLLDWDTSLGGRSERVDILDANDNNVLDSRSVSSFSSGVYLVWNLTGHVIIRITNTGSSSNNAVLSGIFFGGGGSTGGGPAGTAAFLSTDTTHSGTWKGIYGADGFNVIGDTVSYPAYVTVTPAGNWSYTWASSTTDPRALQQASSTTGRIAACWYSSGSFTIDLKFNDTNTHQVEFYLLDWDTSLGGRSERVDILDGNYNVLDSRTVTGFSSGQYWLWNLSGHVIVQITNTSSSSNNAVLSGIFFR